MGKQPCCKYCRVTDTGLSHLSRDGTIHYVACLSTNVFFFPHVFVMWPMKILKKQTNKTRQNKAKQNQKTSPRVYTYKRALTLTF